MGGEDSLDGLDVLLLLEARKDVQILLGLDEHPIASGDDHGDQGH